MSINKVIISGNLTRDPEMRQSNSGMAIMGFGVAVNDRRKNQQTGEWEDYPNFIDCTMFGNRAEAVRRFLSKGAKVTVEGHLRYERWTDQQGNNRSKVGVIVDEIEFMSRNDGQQGGYTVPAQQQRPAAPVAPSAYDEELPF